MEAEESEPQLWVGGGGAGAGSWEADIRKLGMSGSGGKRVQHSKRGNTKTGQREQHLTCKDFAGGGWAMEPAQQAQPHADERP